MVDFIQIFESESVQCCAMAAALFESSDSEHEFLGFTREDNDRLRPENNQAASDESDISGGEFSEDDSSSESEEDAEEVDEWQRDLRNVNVAPFDRATGPTTFLPAEAGASDFVRLVFPDDLLDLIERETNRNAQQKQQQAGRNDQRWEPVSSADIRAYLAIRLFQGIKTLPSECHYWSSDKLLGVQRIKDLMPRNRYQKIGEYLHFNDSSTALPREHPDHDKLHHIRPLILRLSETFARQYRPNRENAIDEGLVKFKERLSFKQYMPLKPTKRGIKVWLRADSHTHFVSKFQVYTGRPQQGQEQGLGERVVKDLS